MNYKCINNHNMEGILTLNKEYKGEPARHLNVIKIFRADDKHPGMFDGYRFQEVPDMVSNEPEVSIYQYTLEVERK